MKFLLVEDDGETANYIVRGLEQEGHIVDHTADAQDGLVRGADPSYDVLIVDRMLPGQDGLSLVKMLRSAGVKSPVLFLTTLGGLDDRIAGFDAGGDDYLSKPFAFSELHARLIALARRPRTLDNEIILRVRDLELDRLSRTVRRSGKKIRLQPREFILLEFLMKNSGRVVTRTMLLEGVWNFHFEPKTNIVETHISRLRGKIDKCYDTQLIQTVRGAGYMISDAR